MQTARYNGVSIAMHWLTAALIVAAFVLALVLDDVEAPLKGTLVTVHKSLGLGVLALVVLRLVWRAVAPPPPLPATTSALVQKASGLGHIGLYVLMAVVPIVGILFVFYRGRGLDFGLFSIASPFAENRAIARPLKEIHELAAYALIGLAALHAAAALWHQYVWKDGLLDRMRPGARMAG
jgi:cytochrome b561